MATEKSSLDPRKTPTEAFELFSIPAFDAGRPEILTGADIGSTKQLLRRGDVLLSKIVPHIRRSWIVEPRSAHRTIGSSEWIIFRSDRFHSAYLRHVLLSDRFHRDFMRTVAGVGGSLLRARPAQVADIEIPLPTLEEQQRIASALDLADALRTKRQLTLAKIEILAQAVFTRGLDGLGPPLPLGDHLTFLTSGARGWAKYYAETGTRFVRSLDVQMNAIGDHDVAFVSPPPTAEARRIKVSEGDVLLTITGSRIGRAAEAPAALAGSYVSQHVAIIRVDPMVLLPSYLAMWLTHAGTGQRQIASKQYGQTKPGLNFVQIRSFSLPTPPLEAQADLMRSVESVRSALSTARLSAERLEALFSSLQQLAFRGEL